MAITATTTASAVGIKDLTVNLTSVTGVTAPNFTTGVGITYIQIDNELMLVMSVPASGTVIGVQRGYNGTVAAAHVINTNVNIGLPGDFTPQTEIYNAAQINTVTEAALNWPAVFLAGSADAIPAGVAQNYVVKTAGVDAMTLAAPTAAQEGNMITVYSDTANAHTITATSLFANGTALKSTATFTAFRGAGVVLRVCNLVYHVITNDNVTFT